MADAPAAAPPNLDARASSSSRNPPTPDPGRCSPFGPIARHAARRAPAALPPPAPCPRLFGLVHTRRRCVRDAHQLESAARVSSGELSQSQQLRWQRQQQRAGRLQRRRAQGGAPQAKRIRLHGMVPQARPEAAWFARAAAPRVASGTTALAVSTCRHAHLAVSMPGARLTARKPVTRRDRPHRLGGGALVLVVPVSGRPQRVDGATR